MNPLHVPRPLLRHLQLHKLGMAVATLAATLLLSEAAFSGLQQNSQFQDVEILVRDSSVFPLSEREAQLKSVMQIRVEQEPAWSEYVLARRQHEKIVRYAQRQELKEFAMGGSTFEPTLSADEPEDSVAISKLALKGSFDRLYATLDQLQRELADRILTPGECGR